MNYNIIKISHFLQPWFSVGVYFNQNRISKRVQLLISFGSKIHQTCKYFPHHIWKTNWHYLQLCISFEMMALDNVCKYSFQKNLTRFLIIGYFHIVLFSTWYNKMSKCQSTDMMDCFFQTLSLPPYSVCFLHTKNHYVYIFQ